MDDVLNYEKNEDEDYYRILNCDELSTVEQINAEYKAQVLSCHPDKNLEDPSAAERFARLQKAKEVLTDEQSRKNYDLWRNAGIAMSYEKWCSHRDTVHTSMHWATVKKKPMLEESDPPKQTMGMSHHSTSSRPSHNIHTTFHLEKGRENRPIPWERDPESDMLRKFRNYEI